MRQGQTSWPSDPSGSRRPDAGQTTGETPTLPTIESMTVTDGHVAYQDAVAEIAVEADVTSVAPQGGEPERLRVDGKGTVRGEPLDLALRVGSPELQAGEAPLRHIRGEVFTLAGTRATLEGAMRDPKSLSGLTQPSTSPARTRGNSSRWPADRPRPAAAHRERPPDPPREAFRLEELRAQWGESPVEGSSRTTRAEPADDHGQAAGAALDLVACGRRSPRRGGTTNRREPAVRTQR